MLALETMSILSSLTVFARGALMRTILIVLGIAVVTFAVGDSVSAQDQRELESARREFDRHLDQIHLALCNQSACIRQALQQAERQPVRERLLKLLRAAQQTQQVHLAIDQELAAIPSLPLVLLRPDSTPEVERLVGDMRSQLRRAKLIADNSIFTPAISSPNELRAISDGVDQDFLRLTTFDDSPLGGPGGGGGLSLDDPDGGGFGGFGGGMAGGQPQADFDALLELIQEMIPEDGLGARADQCTIDLRAVLQAHNDIMDLLEQLRRLQDLQVTIEVRFTTVNDNFYERIGVDFDFDVSDAVSVTPRGTSNDFGAGLGPVYKQGVGVDVIYDVPLGDYDDGIMPFVGVGGQFQQINNRGANFNGPMQNFVPNGDLDMWGGVLRGGVEVPLFGGFNANEGANLGSAFLSDIEAFFFMAAQADAGRAHQDVEVGAFNPANPIVVLDSDRVKENGTYVGGRFETGIGLNSRSGVSLTGIVGYGATRTNVIHDEWHTFRSISYGLQVTIQTDTLFERPWVQNRRGSLGIQSSR